MLKVNDVAERLGLEVKVKGDPDKQVTGCYISDLLSDVMAKSKDGDLWITLQTHPNIVAVAVVKGLPGIVITNGRSPEPDTAKKAETENITIMSTPHSTFEMAGLIFNLLKSEKIHE